MTAPRFDSLVMQGGGVRCLWQAGFLSVVAPLEDRRPAQIVAVSAGSAIACAFAAGRLAAGVESFRQAVARNAKNVYPSRLLSGERIFPHAAMYRAVLADVLTDGGMKTLQEGPDVDVLLCRPPHRFSAARVTALLLGVGLGRRLSSERLVAALIRTGRLSPEFVSVRSCRDATEVTDLILASSSTPPFTPLCRFRGHHTLDGGVLESVPVSGLRPGATRALVLITSCQFRFTPPASIPPGTRLTTVAPSRHIEGDPWDYANPQLLDDCYSLGQEDGARFLQGRFAGPASGPC